MAIPLGYSRNVIRGHLIGGEIFEWGFWTAAAPSDDAAANSQATAVAGAYTGSIATGSAAHTFLSSGEGIDQVRVYSYPSGGPTASHVGVAALIQTGTTTATCPNQVSVVCTLQTGFSGRRNRGRVYLPCTHTSALVSGQLSSAQTTALAQFMQKFFQQVNSAIGQPTVVLSQVAGSANNLVTIRVDSRLDIQRRRANRQAPAFTQSYTI